MCLINSESGGGICLVMFCRATARVDDIIEAGVVDWIAVEVIAT
jgi:hypothetical protein